MKEILALVAIVLCLLVAYQMHRDRLDAAHKQSATSEESIVKKPLSEYLEPYRKELFSKLDDSRPTDLVPPLEALRAKAFAKREHGDAASRAIGEPGVVALDQMIAAARRRSEALREMLRINSAPTGALEREDSGNTASAFFKQSALRRAEEGKSQWLAGVEKAIAELRRAEAQVAAAYGVEAAQHDYGQRRTSVPHLKADAGRTGNPLDREAYDQRRVIIPRERNTEGGNL